MENERENERKEGGVRKVAFGKEVLIWASSKRGHKNRARSQVSFHLRGSFLGMDHVRYLLYFFVLDIDKILFWCLDASIGDFIMFLWNLSSFASMLCLIVVLDF